MGNERSRYVIVGNGIAGTTCAEQLRRHDPACEIHLFADEPYPLYNRVALPPFLKGKVTEARVILKTLAWHEQHAISLHLATPVARIDLAERTVRDRDGVVRRWDGLLLATGGTPLPLAIPGARGCSNILNFQYLDDAKALLAHAPPNRTVVVAGGSFISYELAEAMSERSLHVIWVMRGPHFLRRVLHPDGGRLVEAIARSYGVTLIYGQEIARIEAADGLARGVVLTDGSRIPCDFVATGIGLRLNTGLATDCGLECRQGIVVDGSMRTSAPDVYAAGDVAEFFDAWTGRHHALGTWNNAIGHGRIAAMNLLGQPTVYAEIPEYTTGMFDRKMMAFGITPEHDSCLESVHFLDLADRTFRQLFFLDGRLVGGVLIGADLSRKFYKDIIRARQVIPRREWEGLLHPPAPVRGGAAIELPVVPRSTR